MSQLMDKVAAFERKTGCEVVFHFRRHLGPDALKKNEELFYKFKLHQTKDRNAILVTIAVQSRHYAIWADLGVARHTGDTLWKQAGKKMEELLRAGKRLEALASVLNIAEPVLAKEQPKLHPHENHLSDKPIIEDE